MKDFDFNVDSKIFRMSMNLKINLKVAEKLIKKSETIKITIKILNRNNNKTKHLNGDIHTVLEKIIGTPITLSNKCR